MASGCSKTQASGSSNTDKLDQLVRERQNLARTIDSNVRYTGWGTAHVRDAGLVLETGLTVDEKQALKLACNDSEKIVQLFEGLQLIHTPQAMREPTVSVYVPLPSPFCSEVKEPQAEQK